MSKDSDSSGSPLVGNILLGIDLTLYPAFIAVSLWIREKHVEIFKQMGMTSLPAPTELVLYMPAVLWACLLALVPAWLLFVHFRVPDLRRQRKTNATALLGFFVLLGFWSLAIHMPIVALESKLSK